MNNLDTMPKDTPTMSEKVEAPTMTGRRCCMNRSELIDVISDALGEADPGAILDAIQAAGWAVVPKENAVKSREFQEVAALVCDDVDTAAKSSAEALGISGAANNSTICSPRVTA